MRFHWRIWTLVLISLHGILSEEVEVTVEDGDIIGQIETTVRRNTSYYSFKGIPFAAPPIGDLRFASPQNVSKWNGTWDATQYGNACIQLSSLDITATGSIYGDEDCLYINVYTPDLNASSNLPVLVWIYGGGFITGNGSDYTPDNFIDSGLVFVTFNYRLGVLGFLSNEDEALPGNFGIKDQIKALKWVQNNIAYFGGDPNNVTIFGESAGAVSVHILVQSSAATGLFQKGIMNSGTTLNLWALNTRASRIAQLTATNLLSYSSNTTLLVENLREVEVETLVRIGKRAGWTVFLENGLRGFPFAPTLEPDTVDAVYVNNSDEALSEGNFNRVPILLGFNSQEAVIASDIPFYLDFYLTNYDVAVSTLTPWSLTQETLNRYLAGNKIKYNFFELESIAYDRQRLINFISADQFNRPIRKSAVTMANYTTVYYYEFGYQGNVSSSDRTYEGVGHAEELDYLFYSDSLNYTETDLQVSDTMVLLWTNFAKFGNPTSEESASLNYTLWPEIDPNSSDVNYLAINESISQQVNPKQDDWSFYQSLWETYNDSTTTWTTY